jgi:transglutaminase-like putative cysteine protease
MLRARWKLDKGTFMHTISVTSKLEYSIEIPTSFVFGISAAKTSHQTVRQERLTLTPNTAYTWCSLGEEGNRCIRLQAQPGILSLEYSARVDLQPETMRAAQQHEVRHTVLPAATLPYLNPSRYCESDRLGRFAFKEFGETAAGYSRVDAICDWVNSRIDYLPGSTDASSSACDVLVRRAGVCRDFAHVSIALCRALGIPARYVSGYAVGLQPPDFHGFFEAFLDGQWYMFDATSMAPVSGFVRIGVGRDAADASFATIVGLASLLNMEVSAYTPTPSVLLDSSRSAPIILSHYLGNG